MNIDEEDKIADYSDDVLEDKVKEIIEEQEGLRDWNKYCDAYKKFHKYEDVETMTDEEL